MKSLFVLMYVYHSKGNQILSQAFLQLEIGFQQAFTFMQGNSCNVTGSKMFFLKRKEKPNGYLSLCIASC